MAQDPIHIIAKALYHLCTATTAHVYNNSPDFSYSQLATAMTELEKIIGPQHKPKRHDPQRHAFAKPQPQASPLDMTPEQAEQLLLEAQQRMRKRREGNGTQQPDF